MNPIGYIGLACTDTMGSQIPREAKVIACPHYPVIHLIAAMIHHEIRIILLFEHQFCLHELQK